MSTNSECEFIEVEPGKWYYVLEDTHAPKNAWDWRENASCWGPFAALDAALTHLHRYHANPGGRDVSEYRPDAVIDSVLADLIKKARL